MRDTMRADQPNLDFASSRTFASEKVTVIDFQSAIPFIFLF